MTSYDPRHDPPAPVVDVVLIAPDDGRSVRLRGQLDTGADISAVPHSALLRLGLVPFRTMRVAGYDGRPENVDTYLVDLRIGDDLVEGVEVVPASRDESLLGRDVLARFTITLNGKASTFEMTDP